jgi:hypothetical protein
MHIYRKSSAFQIARRRREGFCRGGTAVAPLRSCGPCLQHLNALVDPKPYQLPDSTSGAIRK